MNRKTIGAEKWGEPIPGYEKNKITTRAERTCDFLQRIRSGKNGKIKVNAVAAVNTMPWEPFPCTNEYVQAIGIAVSYGKLVCKHGYWDKALRKVITASHSVSQSNNSQRNVAFNIAVSVK